MRSRTTLICLVLCVCAFDTGFAESRPTPHLAPKNASQSEFVIRNGYGKDPFFPKSTRLQSNAPSPDKEEILSGVPDFIVVKGISHNKERKLTIINNYTVGEGEEFDLRRAGRTIRVRCIEIKERSVVIGVDGATKTIPLKLD